MPSLLAAGCAYTVDTEMLRNERYVHLYVQIYGSADHYTMYLGYIEVHAHECNM